MLVVGGVLASALVPGCGRSALDGADGSRALPEDAGPGEARPPEDGGSTDDAGRADAGMPSRCGLPGPVDLDGDGVPFVEESIVELASGMPEEVFPELVVGGGLTLAAFECPEEPSAPACVSTVVTVDETGVHRFQEPLAPFPGSGWFTRKDVLVTDDGSGWVLLRTEGGWFIATSDSNLWFLAAAGADPAEPTLVPASGFAGSFDVIGGLVVMLESGAGVRNSRVLWLDGRTGGVFGEWTFPERMLRVVSLDDDRLRVALHARGDPADLTLVELPAGGGPPVTLATRLREVDEVELGRALPSLLATCRRDPEDPTNCALLDLSGEEPTTRSVVDDLTRRPVGLARSSGPGFSDGERFPWVWIRRAGGPDAGVLGRIQGIGTATTVPTFEASLDGVLNPPNVVIDGAGRNWLLVDRGLDTEVRRVDDDGTLPVIAQGRSGRLVSGGGGVVGGLWLEGRGEPAFACVLQPGEGRCEAVPAGIRPLRGRDPLVAPDGRMRVVFVADGDGDGFPDAGRVSFRIWRSRVVDG